MKQSIKGVITFFTGALCLWAVPRSFSTEFRTLAASVPAGSVPGAVNYQGRLVDNGFPVNGARMMTFRLFNAPNGGALLWTSGGQPVSVTAGVFGTTLAISTQALSGAGQKYLEVQVDTTVLTPREPLNAVPYALVARALEDNLNISTATIGGTLISSGTFSASTIGAIDGGSGISITTSAFFAANAVVQSTLTVQGNAFSIGVSTFVVSSGNIGIGTVSPAERLTVSANATALPAPPSNNVGRFSNADGTPTRLTIDTWGSQSNLTFRRANGTAALQSALALDDIMGQIAFFGYGLSAYSANARVVIRGAASEAWTDAAQGAYLTFSTTQNGTAAVAERARIDQLGNVGIGTTSPTARLHVSTGTLLIDGNAPTALQVGVSTFVVTAGGNVGIGTASPAALLDVEGGATSKIPIVLQAGGTTTGGIAGGVSITGGPITGGGIAGAVTMSGGSQTSGGFGGGATLSGGNASGGGSAGSVVIAGGNGTGGSSSGNIQFNTANTPRVLIDSSGNVGIGSAVPTAKLHLSTGALIVDGNGSANSYFNNGGNVGIGTNNPLNALDVSGVGPTIRAISTTAANPQFLLTTSGGSTTSVIRHTNSGAWSQNATDLITVLDTGNVGIGASATAPQATLDVGGGIGHQVQTITQLRAIVPAKVGVAFFCSDCSPPKLVVSTGTAAANFADAVGGTFK